MPTPSDVPVADGLLLLGCALSAPLRWVRSINPYARHGTAEVMNRSVFTRAANAISSGNNTSQWTADESGTDGESGRAHLTLNAEEVIVKKQKRRRTRRQKLAEASV